MASISCQADGGEKLVWTEGSASCAVFLAKRTEKNWYGQRLASCAVFHVKRVEGGILEVLEN